MRALLAFLTALLVAHAIPAWATFTDPLPINICPGGAALKGNYAVLDVSGDGGLPPPCNGTYVETAITCISKAKAGALVDFTIEYFDASGVAISAPFVACGVGTGASVTFTTSPAGLPPPYVGALIVPSAAPAPGPFCAPFTPGCFLHGSARVLATSKRVQCAATRIDFLGPCFGIAPMPLSTKDLTILDRARQLGD